MDGEEEGRPGWRGILEAGLLGVPGGGVSREAGCPGMEGVLGVGRPGADEGRASEANLRSRLTSPCRCDHRCAGPTSSPTPGSPTSRSGQTARSWPPRAGTTVSVCFSGGRCGRWPCWPSTAPPSTAWPLTPRACWPRALGTSALASGRSTHPRDSAQRGCKHRDVVLGPPGSLRPPPARGQLPIMTQSVWVLVAAVYGITRLDAGRLPGKRPFSAPDNKLICRPAAWRREFSQVTPASLGWQSQGHPQSAPRQVAGHAAGWGWGSWSQAPSPRRQPGLRAESVPQREDASGGWGGGQACSGVPGGGLSPGVRLVSSWPP